MKILVFDIGGTSIKYGLCENGVLSKTGEHPTEASMGGKHILSVIMSLAEQYPGFEAIGISTAGQVNAETGTIIYANSNIPAYTGTEIKTELESRFQVPVAVENDVNAAALGEAIYGAGKGFDSFLCLTYGTGVGGSIIENKQVYHGASFSAGEFGGIVTHAEKKLSGCDVFDGCYERYASTSALVNMLSAYDHTLTSGRLIFEQITRPEIKKLVDQWIDEIVIGLSTLVHIFNPSCIVLGGGIMEQTYVIEEVRSRLPKMIMPSFAHVQIEGAMLGNSAGLLGAYHLARHQK